MDTYSSNTTSKDKRSVNDEYDKDTIIRIISFPFGGAPFISSRGRF